MSFIKELLTEMNAAQQAELEAEKELADSGVEDIKAGANKALLAKKTREKQKQLDTLTRSDDPIDRQIANLRRQIASLLAKKRAQQQAAATKAV